MSVSFFFFTDAATIEISTLSLHDALPICRDGPHGPSHVLAAGNITSRNACRDRRCARPAWSAETEGLLGDRKSTRLNSSHVAISYAVFCLKKKIITDVQHSRSTSIKLFLS